MNAPAATVSVSAVNAVRPFLRATLLIPCRTLIGTGSRAMKRARAVLP